MVLLQPYFKSDKKAELEAEPEAIKSSYGRLKSRGLRARLKGSKNDRKARRSRRKEFA